MKPHRLIALLLAASLFVHGSPESDKALVALAEKLTRAEKVTAIKSAKDLDWMVGKWRCTERLLHGYRGIMGATFPNLNTIIVEDDDAAIRTPTAGTYQQVLRCQVMVREGHESDKHPTDNVVCEIDEKGYRFGIPVADWLWLRKEPVEKPSWFILQHQDTGDLLLFERVPEKPNPTRCEIGPFARKPLVIPRTKK